MAALRLRSPVLADELAFRAAAHAFGDWEFAFRFDEQTDFGVYVARLERWSKGEDLPERFVPNTFLLAVVGAELVGRISIRHRLNDFLRQVGGHIGYGVVPEHRRKGYGTEMLRQGVRVARELGIERALITCDDDNEASYKIIERNGGVLENVVSTPDAPVPKRRYWIDTREHA